VKGVSEVLCCFLKEGKEDFGLYADDGNVTSLSCVGN